MEKKLVLLKTVSFVFLVIIVFTFLNVIAQPIWTEWNNYNTVYGFYEEPENTIETIFLGASIVDCGIIPMELYENYGICAYNFGGENQPMLVSYYWLEEPYRLHSETLDTVVIDASSLRYDTDDSYYDVYYRKGLDGMKPSFVKLHALRAYAADFKSFIACLIPVISYHDRWESIDSTDFEKINSTADTYTRGYYLLSESYYFQGDASSSYTDISIPDYTVNENAGMTEFNEEALFYLKKITDFCDEHELKLVLMKTPSWMYNWSSENHNAVQSLADEYQIDFIDFNYLPYIDEMGYNHATDSWDGAVHMNYYGASKLTDWFGKYLIEECGNIDRRDDERYSFLDDELEEFQRYIFSSVNLEGANEPSEYLECLLSQDDYVIFISVKDEASAELTQNQREYFLSIGLGKLANLDFRNSYLAIIDNGTIIDEQIDTYVPSGDDETESESATDCLVSSGVLNNGTSYVLVSGGNYAGSISSCLLDSVEYSTNEQGLNFVVYDKKSQMVVDATSFNTYLSSTRGTTGSSGLEQSLAEALAVGTTFCDLSDAEQTLYQYNLACEMKKLDLATEDDDLLEYLQYFWDDSDYTVFIAAQDDAATALTDEIRGELASMGLVLLSDIVFHDSYIAVACGGELLFEDCNLEEEPLELQGGTYSIISGGFESGNTSSIMIDAIEYSGGSRGLNIAVYNNYTGTVVSTRTFDTYEIEQSLPA